MKLNIEDVKELKIDPSEPQNVISMEKMYENNEI